MIRTENLNDEKWILLGYRGAKGEPGPKGLFNHWCEYFSYATIEIFFIGEPGRSIAGSPGIDGYPGPSGLIGSKGKWSIFLISVDQSIILGERGLPGLPGLPGNSTATAGLPGQQGRMFSFLFISIIMLVMF